MKGIVDSGGRSLLTVQVRPRVGSTVGEVEVWIDTGFTGDLVMPQASIDELGFTAVGKR